MASTRTADARSIAQRNSAGSAVAALMNPALTKRALTRDHVKENLLQLRDKQRANAEAREQASHGESAPFKLEKFTAVESRVFKGIDMSLPEPALSRSDREAAPSAAELSAQAVAAYTSVKERKMPAVPRRDETNMLAPRNDVNFKAVNARKAAEASASASAKAAKASVESPTRTKNYGKVPAYLKERQAEMQAEVERKLQAEVDKDVPPGMIRMTEEERQKTLELLRGNKAQAEDDFRRLPFRTETPSQIERQQKLIAKIKEIDDALKVFSRSPVYITA